MKILHVGFSDTYGGASKAMMRIHQSLLDSNINSNVLVMEKLSNTKNVFSVNKNKFDYWFSDLKIKLARQKKYIFKSYNYYSHSLNIFPSKTLNLINKFDPDIVHLHWINNEMISIKQISKIKKPIIWTMMDMWPMCGGEHYTESIRYIDGYNNFNRDPKENGFDLNKWLWNQKIKYLRNKVQKVICISDWLKNEAQKSFLFRNINISKINPPIDNNIWKPVDKIFARKTLNIPLEKKVLLFLSTNGIKDKRKGYEYIDFTISRLSSKLGNCILLILDKDSLSEKKSDKIEFKEKINFGDTEKLKQIYSSCDILLAPSKLEAFGQVAIEAASCGKPCIGFKNTGLDDAINHKETGYLAKYMDQDDFDKGIDWVAERILENENYFQDSCIKFVNENFTSKVISQKYLQVYNKVFK